MAVNLKLRYWELWDVLKARLNADPDLTSILGGPNRVYKANDDYSDPEADENTPWGRVVIVPSDAGWPAFWESGKRVELVIQLRSEMNDFNSGGYDVNRPLDAAQDIIFHNLDGLIITQRADATPLRYFTQALPMWCADWAQPMGLFDEPRGIWWKASRWSLEVAPVVA